jgi:hypothetical protein
MFSHPRQSTSGALDKRMLINSVLRTLGKAKPPKHIAGVDKTKNNSGASIFFSQIQAKKTMTETKRKLHILKCHLKTSNLLINTRLD